MFARNAQNALFAAAAIAASAIAVGPAVAETAGTIRTAQVSYADLNLASDAGVATLNQRIRIAARSVCGTADGRDLRGFADMKQCREEAVANARRVSVTLIAQAASGEQLAGAEALTVAAGR